MREDAPLPVLGDKILAALCSAVTSAGGEVGISLLLGGNWLTGMLCSPRSWYQQVAHLVDQESDSGFGVVFRELGRAVSPTDDEIEAAVATPTPDESGYLHLRDARTFSASGTPVPESGALIRVRIERVDAWAFGSIGPPGYEPPAPPV